MALLGRSRKKDRDRELKEKLLDVDASMQGSLVFKDSVNLRINGKFEGNLDTKGNLTVGEAAVVNADIVGDSIVVAGCVNGNIIAKKELKLIAPAQVVGNVKTPRLSVADGAVLHGNCQMLSDSQAANVRTDKNIMNLDELSIYLEVDTNTITDWASQGKIPAVKEGNGWKFDKLNIDQWIANGKVK